MTIRHIFRWTLPVCLAVGFACAQVSTPRIGLVRYTHGSVWTVNGLKANFVLGKRLFTSVSAASFSDTGGLIAVPGEIDLVRLDGSVVGKCPTEEPAPILDISGDLTTASVLLPATHMLLRWNGNSFTVADAQVSDSTFHQKSFTLYSDANGFEVQDANGTTRTLPISAADVKIERMSGDWLHLSSASMHRDWALLLTEKELQLCELPEPQEESK